MPTIVERFWPKVAKNEDGCWEWTAYCRPGGYGRLNIGRQSQSRDAHRISWELHFGPIPAGMSVLHRCDNPPCVRPDHLFLGTQTDNLADMTAKGRRRWGISHHGGPKGEANHNAKLTRDQVLAIRERRENGAGVRQLAREYGVDHHSIRLILAREMWGWL
jgi:hypothetical protein